MAIQHVLIAGDFASVNGGQAKVAIDSAILLADSGLDVTFFAATGPVSPRLSHPRVNVICLDQHTILDDPNRGRAIVQGLWNRSAASALKKAAAELDPEHTVLHCHGYAKALSPSIGPVLAHGPLHSVFTMHEYFLACPNGGFFDYQRNEICTRTPLGASCLSCNCDVRHPAHKAWRVLRGGLARGPGALPRGLKDVIYISETQRRVMAPHLGRGTRLHHVSNPVAAGGPPVDAQKNDALVFVGRLNPEKGGLHFAQATAKLDLPAVFVGDGPERAAIEDANPQAHVTGWVSPDEVQHWLGRARALVFPSFWYEGQPLVPIEALLRGVPVICGDWSAAVEEVEDGRNGLVYHAPTIKALTGALSRLDDLAPFDSTELAARVSEQAHVARLIEVYDGILSRAR